MEMKFTFVGNACWILEVDPFLRIACDPALAPAGTRYMYRGLFFRRVRPPVYSQNSFRDIDLWLISHNHFDHLDRFGIAQMQPGSEVVAAGNCRRKLKRRKDLSVRYPDWLEEVRYSFHGYTLTVLTVPACHGRNRFPRLLLGRVNGYLVIIKKGGEERAVYVSSDTVFLQGIADCLEGRKIDLFIPNMGGIFAHMPGGPYTMDEEMLEHFVRELKPGMTLPVHVDDFSHFRTHRDTLARKYRLPEAGVSRSLSL